MRRSILISRILAYGGFLVLSTVFAWAQNPPRAPLQYLQTITIPGWKHTGKAGNANVDLLGYNAVTRMMYLADRTNNGIDVIDTHANVVVGLIKMPPTSPQLVPATGPNGAWVAIDLQQLVVTDGLQSVYVWDLRAPQAQPDIYTFPTSMGTDTDGIAYDPINQTVYVVTDNPPEYLIGINLAYKKVVTLAALPASSDLIAFNPTDGKIYIGAEDADGSNANAGAGVLSFDPATNSFATVAKIGPPCPGHGIDIDPVANVAVVGCAASATAIANAAVNLSTGAIKLLPDVGGTDAIVFNPNTRRFYMNASNYNSSAAPGTTLNCPTTVANVANKRPTLIGVVDALAGAPAELTGVICGGGGHIIGVDPITNLVYLPTSQYPVDPTSTTSGANGVAVFRDTGPLGQPPVTQAQATLTAIPGSGGSVTGTVQYTLIGRRMHLTANATALPSTGRAAWVTIPTTVSNEFVACAVNPSNNTAGCSEDLLGDPLIGAVATLSVDSGSGGVAVARGTIH
jgi:hypothetical protein